MLVDLFPAWTVPPVVPVREDEQMSGSLNMRISGSVLEETFRVVILKTD